MTLKKGDSEKYQKVIKLAYSEISKLINNQEDIKELSHMIAIKYFLNKSNIKNENNWIITAAKNAAIDFLRKSNHDLLRNSNDFEKVENRITANLLENKPEKDTKEILENAKNILSVQERKLLELYFQEGKRLKKISRYRNIGYEGLKKKLYRLKKEIKAEYNRKMGMIATKEIIGARLHENIIYFVKQFQKAIEENSLDRMKFYFRDCPIPTKIPDIKISKIIQYEVKLIDKNTYKLVVYYINGKGTFSAFNTIFEIYNRNSIRILDFPKTPTKIIAISKEEAKKIEGELVVNEKGMLNLKKTDLEILLKEKKVRTEVIFENEE